MKKVILQQYFKSQINNGGPATCAILLMNSFLKDKYEFVPMDGWFPFKTGFIKQFLYFYKTIKEVKPDLVHIRGVQLEGFYGILAAKLLGVKSVLSVDGMMIDAQHIGKLKRSIFKYILEPFALRNADLTYCVCKSASERDFVRKNTKNLYGYIHNAAPLYDLSNKECIRELKRKDLNLDENKILITNIGRITKEKGIHILLESFSNLQKEFDNIVLCIAGNGDYIAEIEDKYIDLINEQKILLLGKISDVKETLVASDIFVFPSFHENLSNSLLEAATVGLPIIATNVDGNPEVIDNNDSGLLVPVNDVEELTKALERLIVDKELRVRLGLNAQNKISKEFSQSKIFDDMSKMYEKLLS